MNHPRTLAVAAVVASLSAAPAAALKQKPPPKAPLARRPCSKPDWLDKCTHFYLDFGSTSGGHARQFFATYRFPDLELTRLFNVEYGTPQVRGEPNSGYCYLGWDPELSNVDRTLKQESEYQKAGWMAHFFHCVPTTYNGTIELLAKEAESPEDRLAPAMDLGDFLKPILAKGTVPMITMLFSYGRSWNHHALDALLKNNVLCTEKVKEAAIRFEGIDHAGQFNSAFKAHKKGTDAVSIYHRLETDQDCPTTATNVVSLRSEKVDFAGEDDDFAHDVAKWEDLFHPGHITWIEKEQALVAAKAKH